MNTHALLLALALILMHGIEMLADRLNLRTLQRPLPKSFEGVYDAEAYAKLQRYTADGTRFGFVEATFSLLLLLTFWFAGGFGWLDRTVAAWQLGPIVSGTAYFAILWTGRWLAGLPFDIYNTFVIEERHGFNRTTPGLFVVDTVKSLVLTALLGLPLAAGVLALFLHSGPQAWMHAWLLVGVVMLVLTFLAPRIILPLFYKFSPLQDGPLREGILEYARKNKFPLGGISVMDGSRRSAKSNAFFTGFGKGKRVVLYDTLVQQQPVPELVAVLAHEVGHYRKGHIPRRLVMTLLGTGLLLWMASLALQWPGLVPLFKLDTLTPHAGLVVFFILIKPASWLMGIVSAALSRKDEFEADRFAKETTGSAEPLADALRKLSKDNLSNLEPHPLSVWLHHSHPPVLERIKALQHGY